MPWRDDIESRLHVDFTMHMHCTHIVQAGAVLQPIWAVFGLDVQRGRQRDAVVRRGAVHVLLCRSNKPRQRSDAHVTRRCIRQAEASGKQSHTRHRIECLLAFNLMVTQQDWRSTVSTGFDGLGGGAPG